MKEKKYRRLNLDDYEVIECIMECLAKDWLDCLPRFSEEYTRVVFAAREIFFMMEADGVLEEWWAKQRGRRVGRRSLPISARRRAS